MSDEVTMHAVRYKFHDSTGSFDPLDKIPEGGRIIACYLNGNYRLIAVYAVGLDEEDNAFGAKLNAAVKKSKEVTGMAKCKGKGGKRK